MKQLNGLTIDKLGFQPLKLGDLIYFEGPLLSLYIDKFKPDTYYLYKWVDNNANANRWLITQVNASELISFFNKSKTLREIILANPICYCINMEDNLNLSGIMVCSSSDLPGEYLPQDNSYFSEEKYSEFASTFNAMISNNNIYSMLQRILNEIDQLKRNQIFSPSI